MVDLLETSLEITLHAAVLFALGICKEAPLAVQKI